MEITNIDPSVTFFKQFADLNQRVKSLETRPAGEIVIRDSITTSDPETGVDTIFGTLPDGSYGIQEWVNDIIPPNKPSTPILTSVIGVFSITWDGLDVNGFEQPNDYLKTSVQISIDGIDNWQDVDFLRGKGITNVVGEPYAEIRYFRLISYDQNRNASDPSDIVFLENTSSFDDTQIQDRLDVIAQDAAAAAAAALVADNKAGEAQSAANDAASDALTAVGIANGKGKTIFSSSLPPMSDESELNLWIDTTDNANTPKRWNGFAWYAITDKTAIDAAAAAVAAQNKADQAFNNAAIALTAAGNAQTSANGKNNVYYMSALPSGSNFVVGDTVFIRSAVGQPITAQSQWDGSAWKSVTVGHQVLASIDLGKATVGELDGIYIKARSISVKDLLIGSFDNILAEPEFNGNLVSWGGISAPTYTVDPTGARNGTTALKIVNSSALQGRYNDPAFSVEAGSVYRISAWVKSDVAIPANGVSLYFRRTVSDNSTVPVILAQIVATSANTWVKITGTYEVPPDSIFGAVGIFSQAILSTGNLWVDNVSCVRATDGNLIVDGAIDGKTITGALIQTDGGATSGIKMDVLGIRAYTDTGEVSFGISAATGEVSSIGTFISKRVENAGLPNERTTTATFGLLNTPNFLNTPGINFNRSDNPSITGGVNLYSDGTNFWVDSLNISDESLGAGVMRSVSMNMLSNSLFLNSQINYPGSLSKYHGGSFSIYPNSSGAAVNLNSRYYDDQNTSQTSSVDFTVDTASGTTFGGSIVAQINRGQSGSPTRYYSVIDERGFFQRSYDSAGNIKSSIDTSSTDSFSQTAFHISASGTIRLQAPRVVLESADVTSYGSVTTSQSVVIKSYADALGTSAATANTIMRRDASARAQVATPSAAADISTKGYVDGKTWDGSDITTGLINQARIANATSALNGLMSSTDKAKLDTANSSSTANTIMMTDANGRFSAVAPTSGGHVANKTYVDGKTWDGSDITTGLINQARIANATSSLNGLMSAADKVNLSKLPNAMAAGTATFGALANGAQQQITVNYPSGRFSAAPMCLGIASHSKANMAIAGYSASALITLSNTSGSSLPSGITVDWVAVQM